MIWAELGSMEMVGRIGFRLLAWLVQRGVDTIGVAALMPIAWPSEAPDMFPPWTLFVAWMLLSGYVFTTLYITMTVRTERLVTYAGWHALLFLLHLIPFFGFSFLAGQVGPVLLLLLGPMVAFASAFGVLATFRRLFV